MIDRRLFLAGTPGLWAAVEPEWHEVTVTSVPGLPRLRVLHLSDLHMSDGLGERALRRALELGLDRKPDLICLTGDYVSSTIGFDEPGLRRLLRRTSSYAPTLAVVGNHDGGKWLGKLGADPSSLRMRTLLADEGVTVLHNRSIVLNGIEWVGMGDIFAEEFGSFSGSTALPRVVLSHNPDGKDRIKDHRWNLMLSGHTHGGQARFWPLPTTWAPVQDKRFLAGLYRWEGRQLFITRGAGSPKHVRFACRPEVSILELAG